MLGIARQTLYRLRSHAPQDTSSVAEHGERRPSSRWYKSWRHGDVFEEGVRGIHGGKNG